MERSFRTAPSLPNCHSTACSDCRPTTPIDWSKETLCLAATGGSLLDATALPALDTDKPAIVRARFRAPCRSDTRCGARRFGCSRWSAIRGLCCTSTTPRQRRICSHRKEPIRRFARNPTPWRSRGRQRLKFGLWGGCHCSRGTDLLHRESI